MEMNEFKQKLKGVKFQGDRFMLSLAYMIKYSSSGFTKFGKLRLGDGDCIYASFKKEDIERTCEAPDIHKYKFEGMPEVLYVNITEDIRAKKKMLRTAARRLSFPAHGVNELINIVKDPISIADLGI